jgi:two-component system response regulator RegA
VDINVTVSAGFSDKSFGSRVPCADFCVAPIVQSAEPMLSVSEAATDPQECDPQTAHRRNLRRLRVVILEPLDSNLQELASALEGLGVIVRTTAVQASHGQASDSPTPDAVLLAQELPPIPLAIPNARAMFPHTRIVALCNVISLEAAFHAGRHGADAVCSRHATPHRVLETIESPAVLAPTQKPSPDRVAWEYLMGVLSECGGNKSKAAKLVGLRRWSLQRKLCKEPPR